LRPLCCLLWPPAESFKKILRFSESQQTTLGGDPVHCDAPRSFARHRRGPNVENIQLLSKTHPEPSPNPPATIPKSNFEAILEPKIVLTMQDDSRCVNKPTKMQKKTEGVRDIMGGPRPPIEVSGCTSSSLWGCLLRVPEYND